MLKEKQEKWNCRYVNKREFPFVKKKKSRIVEKFIIICIKINDLIVEVVRNLLSLKFFLGLNVDYGLRKTNS